MSEPEAKPESEKRLNTSDSETSVHEARKEPKPSVPVSASSQKPEAPSSRVPQGAEQPGEKERTVVQSAEKATRKADSPKYKIPEPLDLMPKTLNLVDEAVKTGAPIGFVNIERFNAGRKLQLEKLAAANGNA
jgi:hypothetical protein